MLPEQRVAERFLAKQARNKTAGEVRFIKDRGGDKAEWAWNAPGPSEREIGSEYKYEPKHLKPLAETLRAALAALGHAMRAYTIFTKIKSATVSPDGSLGGKGYIQKIQDMRRQLMNAIEVLSSITDTLYDEAKAPHWNPALANEDNGPREREEVVDILNDAEEIKSDPEGWAEDEEAEMDESDVPGGNSKTASRNLTVRVASRYLRATDAQVSYAKALLRTLTQKGVKGLPLEKAVEAMSDGELSALIDGLKKQRGNAVWYGNGQFSRWEQR